MFIGSLIVFGSILACVIVFFVMMNSKWFERKFFRVDSDNVSWMLGSAILFLMGVAITVFMDWSTGVLLAIAFMFIGAVASWQKAKNITHKKQTEK